LFATEDLLIGRRNVRPDSCELKMWFRHNGAKVFERMLGRHAEETHPTIDQKMNRKPYAPSLCFSSK